MRKLVVGSNLTAVLFLLAGLSMYWTKNALARELGGLAYHDRNENGRYDSDEPGVPGVGVSNGRDVTETDKDGRWRLDVNEKGDEVFVIKPRSWRTAVDERNLPKFYYVHRPDGSPEPRKYPGVKATGPLPESISFPLYPQEESDQFTIVLMADPQPRNMRELGYTQRDVIAELIGVKAAFGMTLGDIVFDDLTLFGPLTGAYAKIGLPWYNVVGNHDVNQDAPTDADSNESFIGVFGPAWYSFDYGRVHFVVLDDIEWTGPKEGQKRGSYKGGLGAEQLEFLKNDLARVPDDRLVVLTMHIPLASLKGDDLSDWDEADREALYKLIATRKHCISFAGHTHWQGHRFIDIPGNSEPHHHLINVTAGGAVPWFGEPDERGVPHATMRCGAPNGYSFVDFDGMDYRVRFKAASRPGDYQMNIWLPDEVEATKAGETVAWANVFGGSAKSRVEFRVNDGEWKPMEWTETVDPQYAAMLERQKTHPVDRPYIRMEAAVNSLHLWRVNLPGDLKPGVCLIEVRSLDMFKQAIIGRHILHVK